MECVGKTKIRERIGLQHISVVTRVVQILFAYKLGDERDVKISYRSEGEIVANNNVRRIMQVYYLYG